MKIDLKYGENVVIATFTKKDFTTNRDLICISSSLCMGLSFSGLISLDGTDEEIKTMLQPRIRYAILAHNFRDNFRGSPLEDDATDVHFGMEKDLLKQLEKFRF